MHQCWIDHLVVTAPSLEMGEAYIQNLLGIEMQPGGDHVRMGTHNRLLRLGNDTYLEVIAIDPQTTAPDNPRWFGLDTLAPDSRPALRCWVAKTNDIQAALHATTEPLGNIEPMRRGDLEWHITIPANGLQPLVGMAPALIAWKTTTHPVTLLPDQRLELVQLVLHHPHPERVTALLQSLRFRHPPELLQVAKSSMPFMEAHIQTPQGLRILSPAPMA